MMCLMLQEIRFQVQVLKPCKSVQEPSQKMPSIYRDLELFESCGSTAARQIRYLSRFMKLRFSSVFFIQSMIICLDFIFPQTQTYIRIILRAIKCDTSCTSVEQNFVQANCDRRQNLPQFIFCEEATVFVHRRVL